MPRRYLILLAVVFLIAAFFRLARIAQPSLWMDEIWSIEMAMGHGSLHDHLPTNTIQYDQTELTDLHAATPWWNICTHLGGVTHPPLYFIVLRGWMDLFGTGAIAVRSLSVIFSLAALLVLFDLCRFLHGPKIALFAAAIFALAAGQLDFAQEARSYPMLIFFGLCCADLVVRAEFFGGSPGRLIALTILLTAMALTHYLCAGALLALGAYAAIRLRGHTRRNVAGAFAAAAVLSLAVWIPLFITQKHTLPSLAPTFLREAHADEHFKLTLYRIIGLPTEFLLGESRGEALASGLVLTIFLFTIVLPVIRLFRRYDLLLWVLWIFGTIGFVAVMDLARQTTLVGYPRYTILASPAIYVIIAAFDWPRRNFVRDALAISCIALLAIVAIQRCIDGVPAKEDWRKLADDLNSSAAPDDLLVFYNADPWVSSGTWYMGFKYYDPQSQRPWLILNRPADATLLRQIRSRPCLWMVGLYPEIDGPRLLPGWRPELVMDTTAGRICRMIPANDPQ
ncbi:MAG TPA: glycosyltransferase family 39 protein [Tepidisphaeraceae bacterium]|nr:glycosyltransferase family 39 protein [Tepidisphaeraceae bacterium]